MTRHDAPLNTTARRPEGPARRKLGIRHSIIGAAVLVALTAGSCTSTQATRSPAATPSPESAPTGVAAFDPTNDVAAQGSVRAAIAASGQISIHDGNYQNVTDVKMHALAPALRFVKVSDAYDEVSFQVRGPEWIALVAMSPSGVCFGALGDAGTFSYTHGDVGQTSCDAADLPYPNPDWPGSDVAQK